MLTRILEYFGFHPCTDVWAENELLRKQLAAAEVNIVLQRARGNQWVNYFREMRESRKQAHLRIIELENEVNEWSTGVYAGAPVEPVYPRKENKT